MQEKYNNLLQEHNSSIIAEKSLIGIYHLVQHKNIAIYFPCVTVYHTLMIFTPINAKYLVMQRVELEICTLKLYTILWHFDIAKKFPLLLNNYVQLFLIWFCDSYVYKIYDDFTNILLCLRKTLIHRIYLLGILQQFDIQ